MNRALSLSFKMDDLGEIIQVRDPRCRGYGLVAYAAGGGRSVSESWRGLGSLEDLRVTPVATHSAVG